MTSHKDHRLDQLGIASQDEADELQRELGIRFDQFTYHDRKVWNQQNSYLQAHARTRTVSDSADLAGVTVSTAQAWKYLDTLGFTHRLEIADLRFSDSLQVTALERARETRRPRVPADRPPARPHTRKILRQRTPLRHLEVRRAPLPLPPRRPTRTRRRPPNPPRHRQRHLPTAPQRQPYAGIRIPLFLPSFSQPNPSFPRRNVTPYLDTGRESTNGSSRFKRIRPRNRLII